jgi:hypothetical protein
MVLHYKAFSKSLPLHLCESSLLCNHPFRFQNNKALTTLKDKTGAGKSVTILPLMFDSGAELWYKILFIGLMSISCGVVIFK